MHKSRSQQTSFVPIGCLNCQIFQYSNHVHYIHTGRWILGVSCLYNKPLIIQRAMDVYRTFIILVCKLLIKQWRENHCIKVGKLHTHTCMHLVFQLLLILSYMFWLYIPFSIQIKIKVDIPVNGQSLNATVKWVI